MEDYLAAICILIMVLGLGLLVYDKVFLLVVSSTRVYRCPNCSYSKIENSNSNE
ncbi:hypothetical protein HYH96_18125 [Clostridium botulinum]|uniref:Uncharacterized protein n=1 Tax=Clostridium botulinum (strain Okra / Type B1) TaxID=498213 RepID=B1INM8_CLOBK|nr:hypothetical protein [Clostridium botulinum]EKX78765.1 hypothetical protein CFSAN001628_017029 [Clostridium botulinum CFSAN001628]ACA47041.1 hypothetical protein CLD_A0051 [Clostridium botulinum B1 str. Okra]MBD5563648.1 hypothetical protein [Clostridium botulinum]MBD5568376.1 hypothetical protein [Clostridium botulinum]MBD5572160.1 hypothetical protein [Clostridium botulinum]